MSKNRRNLVAWGLEWGCTLICAAIVAAATAALIMKAQP